MPGLLILLETITIVLIVVIIQQNRFYSSIHYIIINELEDAWATHIITQFNGNNYHCLDQPSIDSLANAWL